MKTVRSHARLLVAALAVAVAAVGLLAASDKERLSQAQVQYDRHNYKQALTLADKLLAGAPKGDTLRAAQRLKLLSLCKLRDKDGYAYAKKVMAEHAPFRQDPDLWRTMGDDRYGRRYLRNAYECYKTAAGLYEKLAKPTPAADVWFRAVQCLGGSYDILPAQHVAKDWGEKRRLGVKEAIRIYEHIATLKVNIERKGRALYLAGQRAQRLGDSKSAEQAIALYRRCVKEFPNAPAAPNAQYQVGQVLQRFTRYVEAIAAYRKAIQNYSKQVGKAAKDRIDSIKAPQLAISVDKPFLPGEKVALYWRVRNVKNIDLTAYEVDLTAAVGKMRVVSDAMGAMVTVKGKEVADWKFTTPDAGKHQHHQHVRLPGDAKQTTLAIPVPFSKTGAYLVRARGVNPDNQAAGSSCLVLFSKLSAIAKTDADQVMVFATEALTGAPAHGAEVSVTRHWGQKRQGNMSIPLFDRATGKINDAGVADIEMPRRNSCSWIAAVKKGQDQALCAQGRFRWSWWGYRQVYKVYGFTERPVYRPKQTAHFKQIIRGHKEGVYTNYAKKPVNVTITDPKGKTVYSKKLITDAHGTVEGSLAIGEKFPLGVYTIHVNVAGTNVGYGYARGNRFRVEEYKKPEFKVTVEPGATDYRVGDEVRIKIAARYYFGQPVAGAEVKYTIRKQSFTHHYLWPRRWKWYYDGVYYGGGYGRRPWYPWWRPRFDELVARGTIKTDAKGEAFVAVQADAVKGHEKLDLKFVVSAEVTDASRRVIRGAGEVKVTHAPFFIYPKPAANVYGPGDSVEINVKTEDPNARPVPGDFTVEAWRVERIRKVVKKDGKERVEFEEKLAQRLLAMDLAIPKTGRGSVRFVPDVTGRLKVIVKQKKPKKGRKPVEGACYLWIASKTGAEAHYAYSDLQIVPAKDQYEIGETMKVLVNTNKPNSYVLLTGEADDLLLSRVVHVPKNSKLVEIPVGKKLCPNFTLTASLLRDNKLYLDAKNVIVPPTHRFLKVEVKLAEGSLGGGRDNKFQPREKTKVRLTVTDVHTKKPVVGQVALMMVDSSVYYIQPEFREAIEKAFYGFTRRNRVRVAEPAIALLRRARLGRLPRGAPLQVVQRAGCGGARAEGAHVRRIPPQVQEGQRPAPARPGRDGRPRVLQGHGPVGRLGGHRR